MLDMAEARLLGSTYGFDRAQIEATIALTGPADGAGSVLAPLKAAARQIARTVAPSHVRWIDAALRWDDLV
ncbi:MAG: hypothetical protein EOP67_58425, partial [Sphingomonas sp.]